MECPLRSGRAAELIVDYHAQTLDPQAAAVFEQHLKTCAACRELADAQQMVWSALDEWKAPPVSPDFDLRLFGRIAYEQRLRWWQRRIVPLWSPRPAISVATACVALLAAFLLRIPSRVPARPLEPKFQIEQVEHALDDMDLLSELGVEAAPPASGGHI
jgi:hypothetical protein